MTDAASSHPSPSTPGMLRAWTWVRPLGISAAVWAGIWLAMTGAFFAEALRRGGVAPSFLTMAWDFLPYFFPWVAFSLAISHLLRKDPPSLTDPRRILKTWIGTTAFYFVPYILYETALSMKGQQLPWRSLGTQFLRFPVRNLVMDYLLFLGCLATHFVIAIHQANREVERRHHLSESENLRLRLELEQQRLRLLQSQLEPHFLFNALNAIGALIRQNEPKECLRALAGLSDLLRYALSASQREWTSLGEEISFVNHYLEMQQLRFQDRLQVTRLGITPSVEEVPCPPLILQPLVENALRHDVELHEGVSDLWIEFRSSEDRVDIEIHNPFHAGAPPNPGLGLGLKATAERLHCLYGEAASLRTERKGGRFHVHLSLPSRFND